jgi:hypothetical protein
VAKVKMILLSAVYNPLHLDITKVISSFFNFVGFVSFVMQQIILYVVDIVRAEREGFWGGVMISKGMWE